MARCIYCVLLPIVVLCAPVPPSSSCLAGDTKCGDEGVVLLQKVQSTKKVAVAEDTPAYGAPYEDHSNDMARVTLHDYPGYKGKVHIGGDVNISVIHGAVAMSWALTGADAKCSSKHAKRNTKANACGLHIHKGTSCSKHSEVGGHLFYKGPHPPKPHGKEEKPHLLEGSLEARDPWENVVYITYGDHSTGSTSVLIGKSLDDIIGHAFVVHDHSGGRVACGLIQLPARSRATATGPLFLALLTLLVTLRAR